jgi:hypothetical protein
MAHQIDVPLHYLLLCLVNGAYHRLFKDSKANLKMLNFSFNPPQNCCIKFWGPTTVKIKPKLFEEANHAGGFC